MFLTIWVILLSLAVIYLFIGVFIIISNNNKTSEARILDLLIKQDIIKLDDTWEGNFPDNVMDIVEKKKKK